MRPSSWADRLLALSARFVGLIILIATLLAAGASFLYNRGEEADRADRVAIQANMRLRDHIAVLEGVRALYQSDSQSSGPGIRAYLTALRPQIHAPGMEGIGIAVAMRQGSPAAAVILAQHRRLARNQPADRLSDRARRTLYAAPRQRARL